MSTPVTKADLDAAIKVLRDLIENEMMHQANDIAEGKAWRVQFMAEGGPWRTMDKRVSNLEYLARNIKWVIAALTPIALWTIQEMGKALVAWLRGSP